MAVRREPKLVTVVRKALAAGPVPGKALVEAVQQAGLRRVDSGLLSRPYAGNCVLKSGLLKSGTD